MTRPHSLGQCCPRLLVKTDQPVRHAFQRFHRMEEGLTSLADGSMVPAMLLVAYLHFGRPPRPLAADWLEGKPGRHMLDSWRLPNVNRAR